MHIIDLYFKWYISNWLVLIKKFSKIIQIKKSIPTEPNIIKIPEYEAIVSGKKSMYDNAKEDFEFGISSNVYITSNNTPGNFQTFS